MSRTALQEQFGDAADVTISSDYQMRLPTGLGGVRFYVIRPDGPGLKVTMPSTAGYARLVGGEVFTVINLSVEALTVQTAGLVTVATLAADEAAVLTLVSADSSDGTWFARKTASADESSPIAVAADVFSFTIGAGSNRNARLICNQQGYAGVLPARVTITLADGAAVGSSSTGAPAIQTGTFPANSLVTFVIGTGSRVCGKGGDGGIGAGASPVIASGPGFAGGVALRIDCNAILVSSGKIQGGGGGGGGGNVVGAINGPGGGGGAGYFLSSGGTSAATSSANLAGGSGGIESPGAGGGVISGGLSGIGGVGGAAGSAGGSPTSQGGVGGTGGAGGAAGAAIVVNTTGGFSLTKVVAGTISGAESTV